MKKRAGNYYILMIIRFYGPDLDMKQTYHKILPAKHNLRHSLITVSWTECIDARNTLFSKVL